MGRSGIAIPPRRRSVVNLETVTLAGKLRPWLGVDPPVMVESRNPSYRPEPGWREAACDTVEHTYFEIVDDTFEVVDGELDSFSGQRGPSCDRVSGQPKVVIGQVGEAEANPESCKVSGHAVPTDILPDLVIGAGSSPTLYGPRSTSSGSWNLVSLSKRH